MTNARVALLATLSPILLACCPSPKLPKGPAPEYEDPPPPSWLLDGGAGAPSSSAPAPSGTTHIEPTPVPSGAGPSAPDAG